MDVTVLELNCVCANIREREEGEEEEEEDKTENSIAGKFTLAVKTMISGEQERKR